MTREGIRLRSRAMRHGCIGDPEVVGDLAYLIGREAELRSGATFEQAV